MFDRLAELVNNTYKLREEVRGIFRKIRSDYPCVYYRKKGVKVPYIYKKYSTEYLNFDYNTCAFYLKFGEDRIISFSPNSYRKTWAFNKEDFE